MPSPSHIPTEKKKAGTLPRCRSWLSLSGSALNTTNTVTRQNATQSRSSASLKYKTVKYDGDRRSSSLLARDPVGTPSETRTCSKWSAASFSLSCSSPDLKW
ncbi:hypothetical protein EYF80_022384 [Liparis tanakae]|uniref:Uncharacterized protein n=1 Tax=Liparis tanakae TaxID=230148 RepID=A0A4Z2HNN8_9TELE|nr:hypothetical protein EYF80_022384 [Liparis tanakae]